jgi:3-methyl-2-oxobutanoate hydroxymethyltransferase
MTSLSRKITLNDLRAARENGDKMPMLTCYDFTTARLMQEAGVPMLLVGDSAGSVILGHDSTVPVQLPFMIELTAAVRRGAPLALLVSDMPFGSYHESIAQGVRNVCQMVQLTGCDMVKLEVAAGHLPLVSQLADMGVAVMAHVGLRPQTVGLLGGYRAQGRSAAHAATIVKLAREMEGAGAAAILLEAVPAEVSEYVVQETTVPVIGCGAGSACHGSVVVMHDAAGLTSKPPKFVPVLGNLAEPLRAVFSEYVERVATGEYPAAEHVYPMPADEAGKLPGLLAKRN